MKALGWTALAVALALGLPQAQAQTADAGRDAVQARLEAAPGYAGVFGVSRSGQFAVGAIGDGRPGGPWRWASVSKMITVILVLQQVDEGRLSLDAPVAAYLPGFAVNADRITIRQLLTHTSGLANPDASADSDGDGMPDFYQRAGDWRAVCEGPPRAEPGTGFAYNNCDFLVLGAVLEAVSGQTYGELIRIRLVEPLGLSAIGVPAGPRSEAPLKGAPEPAIDPAAWGPGGGLYGTTTDLLKINTALMEGALISAASRTEMWKGDPASGFAALGVWSWAPDLGDCLGQTRLVERYGEIGGVQVRNFLLPDLGLTLVVQASDGVTVFGEVWQGEGLAVDLIRAAACGTNPAA
ncbi:MAG: beta-lactamase family protein [Alphaproteobacteria bacterium]|nr:beta-lactamase family protein [Alphaproteobacteria bacterium]MBU2417505.1 beta-lactamase family protein [Alphaproteobacteria bacterium]